MKPGIKNIDGEKCQVEKAKSWSFQKYFSCSQKDVLGKEVRPKSHWYYINGVNIHFQFAMVEAIISALADEFPSTLRRNKAKLCAAVCLVLFLCGLPLVTNVSICIVLHS